MNGYEVEWGDGVKTRLTRLDQQLTYAGLLEGIPTIETNEEWYINPAVNSQGVPQRVLLWAPQHQPDHWPESYKTAGRALLPAVRCVASLHFLGPARPVQDGSFYFSYLEVVWFQEEWALPIIPEVLAKIKALNWSDIAIDYEP